MIGRILGELAGRGRKVPRQGLLVLNSKRGPRNFYKGKGVKSTGKSNSKGGFQIMPERLPMFVVPDLTDVKLKPYVSPKTQ